MYFNQAITSIPNFIEAIKEKKTRWQRGKYEQAVTMAERVAHAFPATKSPSTSSSAICTAMPAMPTTPCGPTSRHWSMDPTSSDGPRRIGTALPEDSQATRPLNNTSRFRDAANDQDPRFAVRSFRFFSGGGPAFRLRFRRILWTFLQITPVALMDDAAATDRVASIQLKNLTKKLSTVSELALLFFSGSPS